MNSENICRICLKELPQSHTLYHPACCRKLFGSAQPPELPYSWDQLNQLAENIIRSRVTVPGVQPKLSLHLERSGPARPARFTLVSRDGGYILKPPVKEYPEMPELEHLTMRMAGEVGIATAACGLIQLEDGQCSFITRRMDRQSDQKLPMEDMCQLTDRMTEQKYRGSLEQVGKTVLTHCSNPGFDALRLFELTLFCFLTGNSDMHLKNFSLLQTAEREIRLSPAYDLLPTNLLLPSDSEESALTINGKKRKLNSDDFQAFASKIKLAKPQIHKAVERILRKTEQAAGLISHGLCSDRMKEQFTQLIQRRLKRFG